MRIFKIFRPVPIYAAVLSLGISAHAAAQNSTLVQKQDGKFSGTITAETEDTRNSTYPSMIGSIELRFVWSGIFDQPTEYYQFIWKPSGHVAYAGATFTRNRLDKYPDLARRFDDLRPRNVKLSMDIYFGEGVNLNCSHGYQSRTGCITRFSKTITEVPHLMVASAGQLGDNITPTSPLDNWLGFFETNMLSGDTGTINSKLQGMMRRADSIRVSNLKLVSYEVSPSRVADIIEEFYKREEEEAEREIADEESETSADNEDDGDSLFDKVKGFFSGDDDKAEDDFWSGGSDSRENGRSAQPESDDDFWSGGGGDKKRSSTSSDSDFWSGSNDSGSKTDDMKKVEVNLGMERQEKIKCGTVFYTLHNVGYQDANGSWIIPPKKIARTRYREAWRDRPLIIRTKRNPGPSDAVIQAANRRCTNELLQLAADIEARHR